MSEVPITTTSREVVPAKPTKPVETSPRQGTTSVNNPPSSPPSSRPSFSANGSRRASSLSVPSTSDTTGTIVVCTLVIIGSALIKDTVHGQPSVKPVVTGMMLGGVLLIIGTFAPTFARLLAVTGLVGALMTNGATFINVAEKL